MQLALASCVGVRFIVEPESGNLTIQIGKALSVLDVLGVDLVAAHRFSPEPWKAGIMLAKGKAPKAPIAVLAGAGCTHFR